MGCTPSIPIPTPSLPRKVSSKNNVVQKEKRIEIKETRIEVKEKRSETLKYSACELKEEVDFTPPQSPKVKCHEDDVELIFKSKRANVYTAGATLDNRINYKPKNIIKTNAENVLIRKSDCLVVGHF
jgi:hypothetical protein